MEVLQKAEIELLAQMLGDTQTTKKKLALESGISRQHIGLVAKGKRSLSLKSFCDLADAFGCSATELMEKLEKLMNDELQRRQMQMAAEKSRGLNYVHGSYLGKNIPKNPFQK